MFRFITAGLAALVFACMPAAAQVRAPSSAPSKAYVDDQVQTLRTRLGRDQGGKFIGTLDGLEIAGKIKGSIPSLVTTQTTSSGSVGEGSAFREITRTGGFGQYGDDLLAYNISAPTPVGQFDVGRTTWVNHRNLTGGQAFSGWYGVNSPASGKDYSGNPLSQVWTAGAVIGAEVNAGNRWGELGLQLTPGARFVAGLQIVPDPIPSPDGPVHGTGVPVYHGTYGTTWSKSIWGHRWWVARYTGYDTTPAGGYPDLVSAGSTAENAPAALARYQGYTNRGLDFKGITFAGPQIDAPGWSVGKAGDISAPTIALAGSGSTGDVSGMSVSAPDGSVRTLFDALAYTRAKTAPAGFQMLRTDLADEERWVDEFGPVDTPANTSATYARAMAFYKLRGGGRLKLRHRIYEFASNVRIDFGNFEMVGTGGLRFPFPNTSDPNQYGTVIRWAGASGGTALTVAPTAGPTARPLSRVRVSGIGLDGNNNLGGTGIYVASVTNSTIDVNGLGWATVVGDFAAVTQLEPGYPSDIQVTNIRLGGYQIGSGLIARFDGDPTHATFGNFSKNTVFLYGSYKYNDAVHVKNADTNTFEAYIDRFGAASGETLTSRGLVLFGGGTQYYDFARSNQFKGLWGGGGVYALGTEAGYAVPSGSAAGGALGDNTIEVDIHNGDPSPVIQGGARLLISGLAGDREFGVLKANARRVGPPSDVNDANGAATVQGGLGGQIQFGQYAGFPDFGMWAQTKAAKNDGGIPPLHLMPLAGTLHLTTGHYLYGHVVIGTAHFWIDGAGRLRQSGNAPTSDTDGAPVGGVDPSYPFASLPPGPPGSRAYCTDCREPGQAAGAGTGMAVFLNAGGWRSTAGGAAAR